MTDRKQQPWSDEEDAFLACPVPAAYLAAGALRGRSAEAVRWRRREISMRMPVSFGSVFRPLRKVEPANRRYELSDFPGTDWNQQLKQLQKELGIGERSVWRLRREAQDAGLVDTKNRGNGKPWRRGRRKYQPSDFPDVDWSAPTREIVEKTGLCRTIVYRLAREAKSTTQND